MLVSLLQMPFLLWSACPLPSPWGDFPQPKGMFSLSPFPGSALTDHEPVLTQALTSSPPRYLLEQRDVEVNVRDKWDSTPL